MRTLRLLFAVSVLTLTFCLPTFAGDISTTIATPPANTDGDIHTMRAGDITTMGADTEAAGGSVTGAALSLIQSVLSLF
jgi:hypothetical protein